MKRAAVFVLFLVIGAMAGLPGYAADLKVWSAVDGADKAGKEEPKDPKMAEAQKDFNLGLINMQHGDLDKAEGHFKEAVRLNPASINARLYLADVYQKNKKSVEAVNLYRDVIKTDPTDPRAYNLLMAVYIGKINVPQEAAKVGEEAIKAGVPEGDVSAALGWSYYLMGEMDKAEPLFKKLTETDKKDSSALNNLGLVYFGQGRYKEAAGCFDEAGRINTGSTLAPYFAALAYNKLGEEGKVKESLTEGVKRDPELGSKAKAYNRQFFPNGDPGDLSVLLDSMKKPEKIEDKKPEQKPENKDGKKEEK